jgi:hypothetical protein
MAGAGLFGSVQCSTRIACRKFDFGKVPRD